MIPVLYPSTATAFTTRGLGELPDALSCTVTSERNGIRYLEMEYPTNGLHYSDIAIGRIILAAVSHQSYDIFVIESIEYSIDGTIEIYAPCFACMRLTSAIRFSDENEYTWTKGDGATGDDVHDIMAALDNVIRPLLTRYTDGNVTVPGMAFRGDFSLLSGSSVTVNWGKEKPTAFEVVQAVADALGGEINWNGNRVTINKEIGEDTGLEIRYGTNMTALDAETDGEPYATAVMPKDSTDLSEYAQAATPGVFPFFRLAVADLTGTTASAYLVNAQTLKTAIKVQFDPYGNTTNVETDVEWLHRLGVHDIVTVVHPQLGLKQKAKIVKAVYNVLTERFESVDVGEVMQDITDTIAALVRQDNKG